MMNGRTTIAAKVALFFAAFMAVAYGTGAVVVLAPPAFRQLATGALASLAAFLLSWAFVHWERIGLGDIGLAWIRTSVSRFLIGGALGLALSGLAIGLSVLAGGPLHLSRNAGVGVTTLWVTIVAYVGLSAMEELGFRGYAFRRLHAAGGAWAAQIVIAIAFALYHVAMGWTVLPAFVGTTAGSILFGAAVLRTGGLALPIGLHAAWNIASWTIGQKPEPGLWTVAPRSGDSNQLVGIAIYLSVMAIGVACLLYRRPLGTKDHITNRG